MVSMSATRHSRWSLPELIRLTCADITLTTGANVHTIGKGRKERLCPLWPETVDALVDKWIVMESRRGNDVTRQQLDEIRDYFKGVLTEVDKAFDAIGHTHGGRDEKGKDLKELYIPGIKTRGTKDSSYVDLALYNKETGRYIYIQSVDVRADGSMVPREEGQDAPFAWKVWSLDWTDAAPGEHAITSRAIDAEGNVQPAPDDPVIANKHTYWESNQQVTRHIRIP
jgi:hypothetical protein